jgi:hypothetical protein
MATDFQVKKEQFTSLTYRIREDNMDYFRGKTLSKVFIIGKSSDDKLALLYPKNDVPDDIKAQLDGAFTSVFG